MALTLSALYNYALNQGAPQQLVSSALANAALPLINEDVNTALHSQRLAWAQKTLADPPAMAKKAVWFVLADPNIAAAMPNVSDTQVQTSVNTLVANNALINA